MSDYFQPGDVAVCIDDGLVICPEGTRHVGNEVLKAGSVVRIGRVGYYRRDQCSCQTLFWNGGMGLAARFRKIDAPRTEIADRIRACKPADNRVPA